MQAIRSVSGSRHAVAFSSVYADVQFIERDPNKRLGYRQGGGGLADIKAHPWFKGMDWDAIYHKQVVPPFEPDVSTMGFVWEPSS
jgi:serine/threonine kinase 32